MQTPRLCSTIVRKTNQRSRGPAATAYRLQMNTMPFFTSAARRGNHAQQTAALPAQPVLQPPVARHTRKILGRKMTTRYERKRPNGPEHAKKDELARLNATKRDLAQPGAVVNTRICS